VERKLLTQQGTQVSRGARLAGDLSDLDTSQERRRDAAPQNITRHAYRML
jgi:hypothetical protein